MTRNHVIVGGTSGIGASLARRLLERGHRVLVLSRHPDRAAEHEGLRHERLESLRWDALAEDFPRDALPDLIHGLVYCPGSIRLRPFARLTAQELREDFELNCIGALRAAQGCVDRLKDAEDSSILFFSTVAVGLGMPFHASVAAAKGAVEGLTRSLAAELAPRIRVNALAPTLTRTPMAERLVGTPERQVAAAERHPLKRVGEPDEVAAAALWLLEDAPLTTGQIVALDSGLRDLRTNA